ncbi:hypothetical protein COMA2_50011 [Candidatus Nitrospira nitrificans]|uniref:Uncharacterized protein n=1 Tax=Candidatus Nitrospira nitrificans TaxID=1742973 RepID=A0A0S4LL18_9BACT|nr:hypothetical protein COMA2_50011 [Candidatus Nitrospira nitrificans]
MKWMVEECRNVQLWMLWKWCSRSTTRAKNYRYIRHFSGPSLDSFPIVCYKPQVCSPWVLKRFTKGDHCKMPVFHPPQPCRSSHKNS